MLSIQDNGSGIKVSSSHPPLLASPHRVLMMEHSRHIQESRLAAVVREVCDVKAEELR